MIANDVELEAMLQRIGWFSLREPVICRLLRAAPSARPFVNPEKHEVRPWGG
jgi:hypothetical protein